MHLKNLSNEYVTAMGKELFEQMPKTLLAAIAVSALTCGGDRLNEAAQEIAHEWFALHNNGIVPQKPSRLAEQLEREYQYRNNEPDGQVWLPDGGSIQL